MGATTVFTPASAGTFRVSAYIYVTSAGTAGNIQAQFGFNNGTSSETTTSPNVSATTVGNQGTVSVSVHSAASNPITFAVNFSGVTGGLVYGVDYVVEQLQ